MRRNFIDIKSIVLLGLIAVSAVILGELISFQYESFASRTLKSE